MVEILMKYSFFLALVFGVAVSLTSVPSFAGSGTDHPNNGVGDVNQSAADNASDEGLINGMVGDCAA
jgi:hypothetical protein